MSHDSLTEVINCVKMMSGFNVLNKAQLEMQIQTRKVKPRCVKNIILHKYVIQMVHIF